MAAMSPRIWRNAVASVGTIFGTSEVTKRQDSSALAAYLHGIPEEPLFDANHHTDELWDHVMEELVTAKHSPDLLHGFIRQTKLPGLTLAI